MAKSIRLCAKINPKSIPNIVCASLNTADKVKEKVNKNWNKIVINVLKTRIAKGTTSMHNIMYFKSYTMMPTYLLIGFMNARTLKNHKKRFLKSHESTINIGTNNKIFTMDVVNCQNDW